MKIVRTSTPMHGMYFRREPDLGWWQYWRGVRHVWYWHGIAVWWRMRRRDQPMHKFTRLISGGW